MKLFGKRKKDNQLIRLINNLEKIAKIAVLRIEKDYTNSVIEDLKWIQDSFISVLKISETNSELFFSLIDPNRRYRKVSFQSLDIGDLSFAMTETASPEESTVSQDKYRKLYDSLDIPDSRDDLILKYIQCIFSIWEAANQKNNFTVQKYAVYIYTNWVYILERHTSETIDFQRILRFFLRELGSLNLSLLEFEEKKQNPLLSTLNYSIYLNKIFSDDVKYENLGMYYEFLFDNLYQAARVGKRYLISQFIERCINSNYDPSNFGTYTKLYSLIDKKLREKGIENNQALLKKVPEMGFYRLRYLRNYKEHFEWITKFDAYLETEIFTKIEPDEELLTLIQSQKKLALKCLKYNLLQLVVIKILTYTIFKSDFTIIKHAFDFNQPEDSNALQGNKEIMPTILTEILNYVDYSYSVEHELFSYWEGHHGIEFYIQKLFVYTFYRYNIRKHYYDEDPIRITKAFCSDVLMDDPGRIEGLKGKIERLKSTFNYLLENEKEKNGLFNDNKRVENTRKLFNDIIASTSEAIKHVETSQKIKDDIKTKFLQNVIKEYEKFNFLNRLFKIYGNDVEGIDAKGEFFGINELMERSAFLDNWHIPYIGVIESFGKNIAEVENRLGLSALYETIDDKNKKTIDLKDVLGKLDKHSHSQNIIVGKNIYFHSIFHNNNAFVEATSETTLIQNCHEGHYREMPVFSFYDHVFEEKSILIINTKDIIGVLESTVENKDLTTRDGFSTSFLDYLENAEKFNEFIDNPNSWLIEQLGDNKDTIRKYLEKFVWIRILKSSDFSVSKKRGILYDIG